MTKTDYKRLEAVRTGKLTNRGCGKTFSACHFAADFLEGKWEGVEVAVWSIPRWGLLRHILPMLHGVLQERELVVQCRLDKVRCTVTRLGRTLRFDTGNDPNSLRGLDRSRVARVHDHGEYREMAL